METINVVSYVTLREDSTYKINQIQAGVDIQAKTETISVL